MPARTATAPPAQLASSPLPSAVGPQALKATVTLNSLLPPPPDSCHLQSAPELEFLLQRLLPGFAWTELGREAFLNATCAL